MAVHALSIHVSPASSFADVYLDLETTVSGLDAKPDLNEAETSAYDDVEHWLKIEKDPRYGTYRNCMAALKVHLVSAEWRALRQRGFRNIIDLGVGSGAKLVEILAHAEHLGLSRAIIVDISRGMLEYAFNELSASQADHPFIPIQPVRLNFVERLDELLTDIQTSGDIQPRAKSLFFLLGCTFGNYREVLIAKSLKAALIPGDAIVIGVELWARSNGMARTQQQCAAQYDSEFYRDFINGAAKAQFGVYQDYRDLMTINLVKDGLTTSVPSTWSIVTTVLFNGVQHALIQSNRYHEVELVKFIEGFGFSLDYSVPSPESPYYKHFCFRRIPDVTG